MAIINIVHTRSESPEDLADVLYSLCVIGALSEHVFIGNVLQG